MNVSGHSTAGYLLEGSPIVDEQRFGHWREDLHVEVESAIADKRRAAFEFGEWQQRTAYLPD